jgi:hypothetical protein
MRQPDIKTHSRVDMYGNRLEVRQDDVAEAEECIERRHRLGVFRRQYPDSRLSKDWYIDYRINGRRYKRRIGPNKKLAEQVLMDIEVKKAKGEYLRVHDVEKITVAEFLDAYLTWASVNKGANTYALNRFYADRLREVFTGQLARAYGKTSRGI